MKKYITFMAEESDHMFRRGVTQLFKRVKNII